MRLYALAAPLALWLVLAAPFYCHHGLTTAWSGPQHVHQAESATYNASHHSNVATSTTGSAPAFCPHPTSASTAALAFATMDTFAEPAYDYGVPDQAAGRPAQSGLYSPRSIASDPPERPPSASA